MDEDPRHQEREVGHDMEVVHRRDAQDDLSTFTRKGPMLSPISQLSESQKNARPHKTNHIEGGRRTVWRSSTAVGIEERRHSHVTSVGSQELFFLKMKLRTRMLAESYRTGESRTRTLR